MNPTDALSDAIVAAARSQIGVTEWAEGSNPKIERMWVAAGMGPQPDEVPWCAAFVGAVLGACGVPGTRAPNARSYLEWGEPVKREDIRPGDVLVSWRGSRDSWTGHVEIVTRIEEGVIVWTVGGNEGDAVREDIYSFHRFLGARRAKPPRPKINGKTSTTIKAGRMSQAGGVIALAAEAAEVARPFLPLAERFPPWAWDALAVVGIAGAGLALLGGAWTVIERLRKARKGDR